MVLRFEFDPAKSEANRAKHGLDFNQAQVLWDDEATVEVPAMVSDEARWLVIGRIAGKHWSAVITRRGRAIRLISVRRSRAREIDIYESG